MPLKSKEFDLRALLLAVADASKGAAKARNGSIEVEQSQVPLPMYGDPEILRRALENLIDARDPTRIRGADSDQGNTMNRSDFRWPRS